jgi:hypothetical protein
VTKSGVEPREGLQTHREKDGQVFSITVPEFYVALYAVASDFHQPTFNAYGFRDLGVAGPAFACTLD